LGLAYTAGTTCERHCDVASLLLGALTLPEERELTTHLAACRTCQAALDELGTLPDLLASVPRSDVELINRSTSRSCRVPGSVEASTAGTR